MTRKQTCKIQWVDENGKPTPDMNPAIGVCWVEEHDWAASDGRIVRLGDDKRRFPICANHRERMIREHLEDRHHWIFEPLKGEQ